MALERSLPGEVDTKEFNKALWKYLKVSKKTIPEVLNTKLHFTLRGAVRESHAAKRADIARFGRNWKKSAATIIKSQKLRKPFDVKSAIKKWIATRARTISYLKSGWLPGIRETATWVRRSGQKASKSMKGTKSRPGRPKGWCRPAKIAFKAEATAGNTTGYFDTKHYPWGTSQAAAAKKYLVPALKKARRQELVSMKEYIIKKMGKEAARKAGITHGVK